MSEKEEPAEAAPAKGKTIKVKLLIDPEKADKDAQINPSDLTNAMIEQSGHRIHYGRIAAQATHQVDNLKLALKVKEAVVDKAIRDAAAEEGRKITEAMVEKEVSRHPEVIQLQKAINEAKLIQGIANAAVEAFEHRKDMLIQLGARERKEMEGEMRITAIEARAHVDKEVRRGAMEALSRARHADA